MGIPIIFTALASSALGEEGQARILISKQINNKYLVEGMDIVVKYNMYNVGDNAATNVQVADSGFRQEDFDLVAGQTKYKLDRMAPGANGPTLWLSDPRSLATSTSLLRR